MIQKFAQVYGSSKWRNQDLNLVLLVWSTYDLLPLTWWFVGLFPNWTFFKNDLVTGNEKNHQLNFADSLKKWPFIPCDVLWKDSSARRKLGQVRDGGNND